MIWDNFYTPRDLTKELLMHIPSKFSPSHIIDICGGSGNMLIESSIKYPSAKITYIDKSIHQNILATYKNIWNIHQSDSTNHDIINYFDPNEKKLLLANPPFGYSIENKNNKYKRFNRLEIQILDVNISLLNEGDIFAAVLPENIFSSEQAADFYDYFQNNFETIYLGKPNKYFEKSEVLTRLFVGRKVKSNNDKKNILKLNFKHLIQRGVDNSKLLIGLPIQSKSIEIIHSNFLTNKNRFSCLVSDYGKKLLIHTNDLIIVRVGRNSGKILIPSEHDLSKGISDNLFILRNHSIKPEEYSAFENLMIKSKKGLTTNYITKNDISFALQKIYLLRT